jgi:tRNA G18 (ribose-2'-O)-methylase SpoU
MKDNRNVADEFKGLEHDKIVEALNKRQVELEIAIENTLRDFNMGTIVRSANAFGVRTVHVIGRRQWNKRGAMATDKYLNVIYHKTSQDFRSYTKDTPLFAIENIKNTKTLAKTNFPKKCVLLFGQEGQGISDELIDIADEVIMIEQLGSTRSINVGVAAGIAMYEYLRQHLSEE